MSSHHSESFHGFHILQFPVEILATIFELVILSSGPDSTPHSLIGVASVCKYWKSIIYSLPRCWTTLRCDARRQPIHDLDFGDIAQYLERWFKRSRGLPLSLDLITSPSHPSPKDLHLQNVSTFLANTFTWKSLKLKIIPDASVFSELSQLGLWPYLLFQAATKSTKEKGRGCWDSLERMEIEASGVSLRDYMRVDLATNAPNLQHLKLITLQIRHAADLDDKFVNMSNLRSLEINSRINWRNEELPSFIFRAISQGVCLQSLKIIDHYADPRTPSFTFTSALPSFPFSNHSLTHLNLHCNPGMQWCLQHLRLPSLIAVTFTMPAGLRYRDDGEPSLPEAIKQLIDQSGCRIKFLRLHSTPLEQRHLMVILKLLSSVEDMELESRNARHTELVGSVLEKLALEDDVLPCLRSLSVKTPHLPGLEDLWIREVIRGRFAKFVEDPKRWWVTDLEVEGSEGLKESVVKGPIEPSLPTKRHARLAYAHLASCVQDTGAIVSTLYSRGTGTRHDSFLCV